MRDFIFENVEKKHEIVQKKLSVLRLFAEQGEFVCEE